MPSLDVGMNLLEVPNPRTTALHQVALAHLQKTRGIGAWLNARADPLVRQPAELFCC